MNIYTWFTLFSKIVPYFCWSTSGSIKYLQVGFRVKIQLHNLKLYTQARKLNSINRAVHDIAGAPVAFKTWCRHQYGVGIICPPGWDRVRVATKTWCGHVPSSTCPQARLHSFTILQSDKISSKLCTTNRNSLNFELFQ